MWFNLKLDETIRRTYKIYLNVNIITTMYCYKPAQSVLADGLIRNYSGKKKRHGGMPLHKLLLVGAGINKPPGVNLIARCLSFWLVLNPYLKPRCFA